MSTRVRLLGLAGPLGGIAIGFGRFYTSPMVFGFDPFVGYFAGPLYDTVVDPGVRLLSYRVGSLASLDLYFLASPDQPGLIANYLTCLLVASVVLFSRR